MKFVALSGSLRAKSINTAVVRTAAELCLPPVSMTVYEGLGELPFFNHDVETEGPPPEVMRPPGGTFVILHAVTRARALQFA